MELRHLPFFEALAEAEEGSPTWRSATAGLVLLRLVDAWVEEGAASIGADPWGMRAVRAAIEEMPAGDPARAILSSAADVIATATTVDVALLAPRLAAYGRTLDFQGQWRLAADVYETIVEYVHPVDDADLAIDAHMRIAYCARIAGDLDAAARAYGRAGALAEVVGNPAWRLKSRIGEAKVVLARGNLPAAQALLERVAADAGTAGLTEVRAIALHDLAIVYMRRDDQESAILTAYAALAGLTSPSARDRVLGDIAVAFLALGMRGPARDVHLLLAATAAEQSTRWYSLLNLLDIAALDRCEPVFEQYRRELEEAPLPVELRVRTLLTTGRGYAALGRGTAAWEVLERAAELARRHDMHQIEFEAEAALEALAAARREERVDDVAPTEAVREVAVALRSMRELAGVTE